MPPRHFLDSRASSFSRAVHRHHINICYVLLVVYRMPATSGMGVSWCGRATANGSFAALVVSCVYNTPIYYYHFSQWVSFNNFYMDIAFVVAAVTYSGLCFVHLINTGFESNRVRKDVY